MLNKIKKKVNKFYKLVNKYNSYNFKEKYYPLENKKNYYLNDIKNIIITPTENKSYYNNNELIKTYSCFYSNKSIELSNIINFILLPEILIISVNINMADLLLCSFNKNINITLIVFNNFNIIGYLILKNKYPNINIYFIGVNIDYTFYDTIKKICDKKKFNTIIMDMGLSPIINNNEYFTICGILLCNDFLITNGTYVLFSPCPSHEDELLLKLINIQYDLFKNHNLDDFYFYIFSYKEYTVFIFYNYKNNLSESIYKYCIDILKNYYYDNQIIINYDYSKSFLKNIYFRWSKFYFINNEYFKELVNMNKQSGGTELTYHRIRFGKELSIKNIPIYVNDLTNITIYDTNLLDWQPKCHWGQKKLLLSEIQFFTRICKTLKTKNLKDYTVVYVGSAGGHHLPILYDMFPELIWLLYDPAPFSKEVMQHPTLNKTVFVYNMFFTDETIKHVNENCKNRKILFISDIRVDVKEVKIIQDMRDQAFWGMELNAPFMLLKFRLPYEDLDEIPKNNKQLNLNKDIINNPDFNTDKDNHMVYLKGDIYLQIFPPPYSGELRLFIEQRNNKYDLEEYNYLDIENKIFKYNFQYRLNFYCDETNEICKDIPLKYINLIPGYDTSIECLMEYIIIKDYCEYFLDMNNQIKIIHKMYDMNFMLEKLTGRHFYNCSYDTILKYYLRSIKDIANKEKNKDKDIKLKTWKDIIKIKINLSVKSQIEYIKINGKSILGDKRYNEALKYLNKFYDNKLSYYKLI
jgi:hypothetical protein